MSQPISGAFLERIARTAEDVPGAFSVWNAGRARHGARIREAVAAIMRDEPELDARNVRRKLDPATLGRVPLLRMVQVHMQAIRKDSAGTNAPSATA